MGSALSSTGSTAAQLKELQEASANNNTRIQALEVTISQLCNEVNTIRAGKRKLEQQIAEITGAQTKSLDSTQQPAKRFKATTKANTTSPEIEAMAAEQPTKESGSPFPTTEKKVSTARKTAASKAQAAAAKAEAEGTQGDKSHSTAYAVQPEVPEDAEPPLKRPARSSVQPARLARSKVSGSETPSVTIAQMKSWLEDNGFQADADKLSKKNSKKSEWMEVYVEKTSTKA